MRPENENLTQELIVISPDVCGFEFISAWIFHFHKQFCGLFTG